MTVGLYSCNGGMEKLMLSDCATILTVDPMDKSEFFNRLIETLREECIHAVKASKDAADYATDEESRADSQWDT